MKKVRLIIATAALLGTLMAISMSNLNKASAGALPCNCWYPNTGKYGVEFQCDCKVVNCWINVN